ncbi:hypothetical protein HMPREF9012_0588 [Bacteroidetes bacterium oral taxon 272 str. F0290]|nr:hypothetical protein HMPREF9012_0588 [Bacteroidetes bacterium oral taxon 272 str. F0290]
MNRFLDLTQRFCKRWVKIEIYLSVCTFSFRKNKYRKENKNRDFLTKPPFLHLTLREIYDIAS